MEDTDELQRKLSAWFQILHRLARIQETNIAAPAWTAQPLDTVVAEQAQAGYIRVLDPKRPDGQVMLLLTPAGWDLYDEFCADLANQGRPVHGWVPGRHREVRELAGTPEVTKGEVTR